MAPQCQKWPHDTRNENSSSKAADHLYTVHDCAYWVQITDTPLTPEMTPALEALICSELHHPNILATLRYACRPHKVPYTIYAVSDCTKLLHVILHSIYCVLFWPPSDMPADHISYLQLQ